MAMKFWFGKKEKEPGEEPAAVEPDGKETPLSQGAPMTQSVPVASETTGEDAQQEADKGPAVVCGSPAEDAKIEEPVKTEPQESAVSEEAVMPQSSPAAKVVLKAVGAPVRLAAQPNNSEQVAQPKDQGGAAPAASGRSFGFALRPKAADEVEKAASGGEKAGESPAEAVKASSQKQGGQEHSENIVRPRADQRALYYQLMNGLYDAILILDDQGHVVDCSKRVEELLGYGREDSWDLPINKIITGMTSQMFEHLKRNLVENHHILIDARCFRKDGSSFAGEVGVSTLSLTRGNNIVFAIRSVERRKSAVEDLRKCKAAVEVSLVPTFVCDPDGFFLTINQALLEAFGIPDETQAKGIRFMDLLPDAARFFLRTACGEKLREKMSIPTPDGQTVKIELSLLPVQNGQTVIAVAGSVLQI